MKLIIAIVQELDEPILSDYLVENGFRITKLKTSGGFLKEGNATLLIGVEDDKLEECLEIIEDNCKRRTTKTTYVNPGLDRSFLNTLPVEITVGGATIFILDVEQFIRY